MIRAIKHIAIAVRDVDDAVRRYQALLGIREVARHRFEKARTNEAHFTVSGVQFQLCQSWDADGRFARHIAEHGDEGVHHVCYTVDDIEQALAAATARGATLKPCAACQVAARTSTPKAGLPSSRTSSPGWRRSSCRCTGRARGPTPARARCRPRSGGAMSQTRTAAGFVAIQPEGVYRTPSYVHALRAGQALYLAGQVARDEQGKIVAPGDAAAQARQVYRNIGRVLAAAGADFHHIVKMTTYLVDRADAAAVSAVRFESLGDHRPPHTGVIVAGLGSPELRVEVDVIAVVPAVPRARRRPRQGQPAAP